MSNSRARVLTSFTSSIRGFDSSRQLAMGMSIGAMIGILPKDNILVVGLLVLLILSVSNLITGAIAGISMSLLSPMLEQSCHRIGEFVLANNFIAAVVGRFLEFPLAAWTRLDNTVVCGSLVIGMVAFLPIYFCSFYFFNRYRTTIRRVMVQSGLTNWILGYPTQETQQSGT